MVSMLTRVAWMALLVGLFGSRAQAAEVTPVVACLSDGQRLTGDLLEESPDLLTLRLAGAYVRIPRGSWVKRCGSVEIPTNADDVVRFTLVDGQRLFGRLLTEVAEPEPNGDLHMYLLNLDPIVVPWELVVDATVLPPLEGEHRDAPKHRRMRPWVVGLVVVSAMGAAAAIGFMGFMVYLVSQGPWY